GPPRSSPPGRGRSWPTGRPPPAGVPLATSLGCSGSTSAPPPRPSRSPGSAWIVARPDAVLKVGGSLGRRPAALRRLMRALAGLARGRGLVVVPGGGEFAGQVRHADRRLRLRDSAGPWIAIPP